MYHHVHYAALVLGMAVTMVSFLAVSCVCAYRAVRYAQQGASRWLVAAYILLAVSLVCSTVSTTMYYWFDVIPRAMR